MQLSLDFLNKSGYTCQIVEHWNHFAKKRQDCFGFADILAYHPVLGCILVQTTTTSNMAARRSKMNLNPHVRGWKRAGGRVLLQGWGPKGLKEEEL